MHVRTNRWRWSAISVAAVLLAPATAATADASSCSGGEQVRIESGSTSSFTDSTGCVWSADLYSVGGNIVDRGPIPIANTEDDKIYQTERWGLSGYAIPVDGGSYTVRLHFAETWLSGPGQRVMSASIEGTTVLQNFDVFAEAGGGNTALVKTFPDVMVSDGILNIDLDASVENTMINGVEVIKTPLFTDDFEDGNADGWSIVTGGSWSVVEGRYRAAYSGGTTKLVSAAGVGTWADYAVQMTLVSNNDGNSISIRGRFQGEQDSYLLNMNTDGDALALVKRVNGANTTLDSVTVPLDPGVPYTLRLAFDDTAITGYLNGEQLVSATDATFATGRIAVGGYSKGSFDVDDVVVTDVVTETGTGDRFVTPQGAGAMDGTSWANAFAGDQAGGLQAAWDATGESNTLHVGSGTYTVPQTLTVVAGGGNVQSPKTLLGVNTGGGLPTFRGDWTLANQVERRFINVAVDASYWTIQDIAIENYQYGIYAQGRNVGVRVQNVDVTNMWDGIYFWGLPRGSEAVNLDSASHDIIVEDGNYQNFTRSGVRFRNGVYLATVINSVADGGGAANWMSGNFPIGFRIAQSGQNPEIREHDIVFQDTVGRDSYHENGTNYWNGDGFAAERAADDITYVRSRAFGSTDGGFDDKSTNPVYIDSVAFDNKRNFRVWSRDNARFFRSIAGYSVKRGGSGDSVGLWLNGTGRAETHYSTFAYNASVEIAVEDGGVAEIHDSILATDDNLYRESGTGIVNVVNSDEYIEGVQGTDPQFINGGNAGWEGGSNDFNSQVYGTTKGYHYPGPNDTPYTINLSASNLTVDPYAEATVTAQVLDSGGNPVADPEDVVWYSDDGSVVRVLESRGATASIQGLTAGTIDVIALYKGEEARVHVTVTT